MTSTLSLSVITNKSCEVASLLVFCEHFARSEAHDAASHRSEYSHFEPGESNYWSAQTGGHKQGSSDGHLAVVGLVVLNEYGDSFLGGIALQLQTNILRLLLILW